MCETNGQLNKLCVSLGFFDCMHLGHREIVRAASEYCRARGTTNALFTFMNDISAVKDADKQIYTYDERKELYAACGVQKVIAYEFNDRLKNTSKRDFLDDLTQKYDISAFACGDDYRFGKCGEGDVEYLKQYCDEKGIDLIALPKLTADGEVVSTTRIKELLLDGDMAAANALLSVPYFISGTVVRGRGEGHVFGIPTANVTIARDKLNIKCGVYACRVVIDAQDYHAVTNVGVKPTFNDFSPTVEALIDGFDGDLYGKSITVKFYAYLRDTVKFDTPQALARQIHGDMQRSKTIC